jgi:MFS family permease
MNMMFVDTEFPANEAARPAWLRDRPWAPWAAVAAVCFGAFMGQLDASIVTLTYSALGNEFGASLGAIQWVSLSYLLVLAVLLVPAGRASDARGRKLMYLRGFAIFTVASGACALAPSLELLIAFRAVQAGGAALLQANSIALVTLSVAPVMRRAALGVQAAAQAVGLALGPTIGGVMVEHLGWRSVFWVNIPVGVVAILAGRMMLPRSRHLQPAGTSDRTGFVLLATTAVCALLALSGVSGTNLGATVTVALALAAIASAVALASVERRAVNPLIDPRVLQLPGVVIGLGRAFAGYLVLFAPLVLFPTVFDEWGLDVARGGLVLTWLPAGFAGAAVLGNLLPGHLTNEHRLIGGAFVTTAAYVALVFAWHSTLATGVLLMFVGAGLGLALPANNAAVMSSVPRSVTAVTGGQVNVSRALGTSVGVALTTFGIHIAGLLGVPSPPLVLAALAAIAALIAATTLRAGPTGDVVLDEGFEL